MVKENEEYNIFLENEGIILFKKGWEAISQIPDLENRSRAVRLYRENIKKFEIAETTPVAMDGGKTIVNMSGISCLFEATDQYRNLLQEFPTKKSILRRMIREIERTYDSISYGNFVEKRFEISDKIADAMSLLSSNLGEERAMALATFFFFIIDDLLEADFKNRSLILEHVVEMVISGASDEEVGNSLDTFQLLRLSELSE